MLNRIIKGLNMAKVSPEGQVEQISHTETFNPGANYTGQIRGGMWVTDHNDRIGIVENIIGTKFVDVMYVDPVEGTNVAASRINLSQVKQARFSQIPEKRKPSQEAALAKGYFN